MCEVPLNTLTCTRAQALSTVAWSHSETTSLVRGGSAIRLTDYWIAGTVKNVPCGVLRGPYMQGVGCRV